MQGSTKMLTLAWKRTSDKIRPRVECGMKEILIKLFHLSAICYGHGYLQENIWTTSVYDFVD